MPDSGDELEDARNIRRVRAALASLAIGPRDPGANAGHATDTALPPSMLATFPRIRAVPFRVTRYTDDWWPLCPRCDEELISLSTPPSTATISGCKRCGECSVAVVPHAP